MSNRVLLVLSVTFWLISCASTERSPKDVQDGLLVDSPQSQGMNSQILLQAAGQIANFDPNRAGLISKNRRYSGIDSMLVARGNTLVFERYFNQHSIKKPHLVASLSKSLISAMFGVAVDQKLISGVQQSVYQLMPYPDIKHWNLGKGTLNFHHLLTMSAGWQCDDFSQQAQDCINLPSVPGKPYKSLLNLPLYARPGESFRYNEGSPAIVVASINGASGLLPTAFFQRAFMQPMQLTHNLFNKQMLSSRDMLKFGLLYLNQGVWQGERLLSKEWISQSTKIQMDIGQSAAAKGYGYYWWVKDFVYHDQSYPGYFAWGNGGQFIIVIPELDLVTVFTGSNYNNIEKMLEVFEILEGYVLASIKD